MTMFFCLEIAVVLIALVVAMSDNWRAAAFMYHEVKTDKEILEKDVETLKGEVESLKSRQNLPDKEVPDHISVKVNLMMTRVKLNDILFVKSDGDYVIINKACASQKAPTCLLSPELSQSSRMPEYSTLPVRLPTQVVLPLPVLR